MIRLEPDQEWLPAIKDIGFVKGTHDVTVAEAATQTYQVRKRGAKTGLTGGVVLSIATKGRPLPDQLKFDMIIRPNAAGPPHEPDTPTFFSFHGDSGSVVVNDDNEIVGLLWAGAGAARTDAATPIKVVLDQFRKVDKLDLRVATPTGANPTDATEVQRVLNPAGAPLIPTNEVVGTADQRHERPLSGGSQITAEPFLGVLVSGTLGSVVREETDLGTAYILTSYAGLSANGTRPPTADTDVGQPNNDDSCSLCCSNTVGEFIRGGPNDATMPAALVKLEEDQPWLAEIMQIGLIEGIESVSAADVDSGAYQVRKRGIGTRLTGGIVTVVGGVRGTVPAPFRADSMLIRPHPNAFKPGQDICLSHFLDRGALLVNRSNQVVGLLYAEVDVVENGQTLVHGVATPIQIVIDQLNSLTGVKMQVATADTPDLVQTTIARRAATPHETATPPVAATPRPQRDPVPGFPEWLPAPAGAFAWLRDELSLSTAGRLAIAMWTEHRREIRHLIDHNRKVATVWHRSGGPALLQALVRAFQVPSAIVPATLNGVPLAVCFDRLARVLCKYGSPALQADVAHVRPMLPAIGGLSFAEILTTLHRA